MFIENHKIISLTPTEPSLPSVVKSLNEVYSNFFGADSSLGAHEAQINEISVSSDSNFILTCSNDNSISMRNACSMKESYRIYDNYKINSISISPDSTKFIATININCSIGLFNLKNGEKIKNISDGLQPFNKLLYSKDGKKIYATNESDKILVFNAFTSEKLKDLCVGHKNKLREVIFSMDGSKVASCCDDDSSFRINNSNTGDILKIFIGHEDDINTLCFNSSSTQIVSGSNDCSIRIWEVDSGLEVFKLNSHTNFVLSILFNFDESAIFSASFDNTIKIWNFKTGELNTTIAEAHEVGIRTLGYSPAYYSLISGGLEGSLKFWSKEGNLKNCFGEFYMVENFFVNEELQLICTLHGFGGLILWNMEGEEIWKVSHHAEYLDFNQKRNVLVADSKKDQLCIVSLDKGDILKNFAIGEGKLKGIFFINDDILVYAQANSIVKFDLNAEKESNRIKIEAEIKNFIYEHNYGLIENIDKSIRFYNIQNFGLIYKLELDNFAKYLNFNCNLNCLSICKEKETNLYDFKTGDRICTLEECIEFFVFLPNNENILCINMEGEVIIYEIKMWKICYIFKKKIKDVLNVKVISNDIFILTKKALLKFKIKSENQKLVIKGLNSGTLLLDFLDDNNLIAADNYSLACWNILNANYSHLMDFKNLDSKKMLISENKKILLYNSIEEKSVIFNRLNRRSINLDINKKFKCAAFSNDSTMLALSLFDNVIYLISMKNFEKKELLGHDEVINCLHFTSNNVLISASKDNKIFVWDISTNEIKSKIMDINKKTLCLSSASESQHLMISSKDPSIQVYDLLSQKLVLTIPNKSEAKYIKVIQKENKLIALFKDNHITCFNLINGDVLFSIKTIDTPKNLSVSPNLKYFAWGTIEGIVYIFDMLSGNIFKKILNGKVLGSQNLALDYINKKYATVKNEGIVSLFNMETNDDIKQIVINDAHIHCLEFSTDGSKIAIGTDQKSVFIYSNQTYEHIASLKGHLNSIKAIAFSKISNILASGSNDKTIRIWDLNRFKELNKLNAHSDYITQIQFTNDGQSLVSSSQDKTIILWSTTDWKEKKRIDQQTSFFSLSPNSIKLASITERRKINIWNIGRCVIETEIQNNYKNDISTIDFNPIYNEYLSVSVGNSVQILSSSDGKILKEFIWNNTNIMCHKYLMDGDTILASGEDSSIRIWKNNLNLNDLFFANFCQDSIENNNFKLQNSSKEFYYFLRSFIFTFKGAHFTIWHFFAYLEKYDIFLLLLNECLKIDLFPNCIPLDQNNQSPLSILIGNFRKANQSDQKIIVSIIKIFLKKIKTIKYGDFKESMKLINFMLKNLKMEKEVMQVNINF